LGFFLGVALLGRRDREAHRKPEPVVTAAAPRTGDAMLERMRLLEQRIERIERAFAKAEPSQPATEEPAAVDDQSIAATSEPASMRTAAPTPSMHAADVPPPVSAPSVASPPSAPSPFAALWNWFTGGNALTRIGVVALFFGVAFLLRYLAEHFILTIEIK